MRLTLEQWFRVAERGISGDQIHDILYDWKEERDRLQEGIREALRTIHALHGETAWRIYRDNAPEMIRLRKLLEER